MAEIKSMAAPHQHSNRRRVVITGIGAVTPVGNTMPDTWNGIIEGRRPVSRTKIFDATEFPCDFAYQVSDFKLNEAGFPAQSARKLLNRAGEFGWNAAHEALSQSGILNCMASADARGRFGVCLGVGMGCEDLAWYHAVLPDKTESDESLLYYFRNYPSTLTQMLCALTGAQGGSLTVHTACASSGQALGEAFELIASGDCDAVLTGGADSMINPFQVAGFCLLGALSSRKQDPEAASRPFDADRDGFVLGEGACMLVFEEYEHARSRGALILGEVCGYGVTESAYRITDLHPEGRGVIQAMDMALKDASIRPEDVGYVNAHGTSTMLNDRVESLAISKVFPKPQCSTIVSSTKSMTGHLISAAGAVEFAIAVNALRYQVLPPSVNLFSKDSTCEVELAPSHPTSLQSDYALSNSVGFGGSNTSLIARRCLG